MLFIGQREGHLMSEEYCASISQKFIGEPGPTWNNCVKIGWLNKIESRTNV